MKLSNVIFPELRGLSWSVTKTPEFYTLTKTSPTGLDVSAVLSAYPRWQFSLRYEFLRDDGTARGELQKLLGLFLACNGNVEDFLYLDPNDHKAQNERIGVGDGVTTDFQLCRTYAGFTEPVYGVKDTPVVAVNNVPAPFSVSAAGIVKFKKAPPERAVISWSGEFYYRVKFKESSMEFANFTYRLWEAKKVEFVSVKRVSG